MKNSLLHLLLLVPMTALAAQQAPEARDVVVTQRNFIDFSWAGAYNGEQGMAPVDTTIFNVADYGAIPGDALDDTDAIQRAIDAASAARGGIVQFEPGTYLLNSGPTPKRLIVSASKVVLRGAWRGQTHFKMVNALAPADPKQLWAAPALVTFTPGKGKPGPSSALAAPARMGDTRLVLSSTAAFQPGDFVRIEMQSTAANASYLEGKTTRRIWSKINTQGVKALETHEVASVDGAVLHLKTPLTTAIDLHFPWTASKVAVLRNVGFESIRVEGSFTERFVHHKNAYHDSGFCGVELDQTVHSWVLRNQFENVTQPAVIHGGASNTMMLNTIAGNSGHLSFAATFSTYSMIGLNIDNTPEGQWHGVGASHQSTGSVFWRNVAPNSRGIDSHANFPRHTLFDAIESRGMWGQGGNYADLPNHLSGLVIWNFHQTGRLEHHESRTLDLWELPEPDTKEYGPYTGVNPVLVGYVGPYSEVNMANIGLVESMGRHVAPESLYEAQLEKRLGKVPAWLLTAKNEWAALLEARLGRSNPALGGGGPAMSPRAHSD
ncbi:DUF4955 domain-containing protein [Pseudoduganella sp. OTU4001]|uniref:DUF4955 domain-containing protein n=1 Tax=Pseudoduganella sp. OTU4001 TaxID=3043854 RepID=UPI00313C7B3D